MSALRTELRPILIVDDNLDDTFILSRLISKSGVRNPLQFARDGEDAIERLAKSAPRSDFPPPVAIFTDLRMPGCDGFGLLQWLQDHAAFERVFIAVISSSTLLEDVDRAFRLRCHAYLHKYPTSDECVRLCAAAEALAAGCPCHDVPGLSGRRWAERPR